MGIDIQLPNKLTFKRAEAIKIAKLDGKVLDYWEKEFGGFKPIVNKMGEIFYSRSDIELILKIKHWMIVERIGKSKVKERVLEERAYDERHRDRFQEQQEKNNQEHVDERNIEHVDDRNIEHVDERAVEKKNRRNKQNEAPSQKPNKEELPQVQQPAFPKEKLKIIRKNLLEILTILEKNDKI